MKKQSRFEINNVVFSFAKNGSPFFDGISAAFKPNALNFIQGKNGAGKSTLMRILHGDIHAGEQARGTITIDDHTYEVTSPALAHKVASVPQQFNAMLVDSYTFTENLQCARMSPFPGIRPLPEPKPIPACIEKYGIDYDAPISLLSGGQRQILSILMILQQSPSILLLDEPTATLDEDNAKLIMDFLEELCERESITIILIVHNKELIQQYCQKSYFELTKDAEGHRKLMPINTL